MHTLLVEAFEGPLHNLMARLKDVKGAVMKHAAWLVGILALAALGACADAQAGLKEEKTTLDKVPSAVKAAIEQATAGGVIREIEQEQLKGALVYEVDYVLGGRKHEVVIAADGSLLLMQETDVEVMTIDQVPAAVRTAVEQATVGGEVREIEKQVLDGKAFFEVEYLKDGRTCELRVAEDGTPAPATSDQPDDHDDGDDEDDDD